ncbi:hypothetical protein K474DRAFT_1355853 [Panus rudis PR-1116 ss-1]|nr:hypothetical protein K474DRAFT_1355853 [Panus rudis PR-1116 ss-1]
MGHLSHLTAISSTFYRIATYIFLRVIPSPLLKSIIPSLYVLYISSLVLDSDSPTSGGTQSSAEHSATNGKASPDEQKYHEATSSAKNKQTNDIIALLLSLPSPARIVRILTFAINTLLLLAAADLVIYPILDDASDVVFTRVGAVYPDSVKIVVRYPQQNATKNVVHLAWRQVTGDNSSIWVPGPSVNLTAAQDWTSTVRLGGLWPSTPYEYRLQDNTSTPLPYPPNPIQFRTFPDPRLPSGSHFRFVVSSCTTPNFPYLPFHGRRIKGYDLLADYLWPAEKLEESAVAPTINASETAEAALNVTESKPSKPPAEFMLFLGDFVYADVPIYMGDDKESYRRLYRRNYNSPSYRKVYERLPIFHTYDDHEILNNFAGQGNDTTPPYQNASDAFRLYNAEGNYDSEGDNEPYYYHFRYADVAVFVLDTRRYRSDVKNGDVATRTMLGDKQLAALYEWLGKVNNTATFKFIATSVPFTSLWQHDAQVDSWAAYESEKMALLTALHSVPNVILLSGDRHEFAAIEFNSEGPGHKVVEISTSPLSMFYIPFVRTLRPQSENTVQHVKVVDDKEVVEELPQEKVIKYIATGNYKWSSIEVDTRDLEHPVVHVEVMIDGSSAYRLAIAGQPVHLHSSTSLGAIVPGFKGILNKIGLSPTRWF